MPPADDHLVVVAQHVGGIIAEAVADGASTQRSVTSLAGMLGRTPLRIHIRPMVAITNVLTRFVMLYEFRRQVRHQTLPRAFGDQ